MLTGVYPNSRPSANWADARRATTGERLRTGLNETETETQPVGRRGPFLVCADVTQPGWAASTSAGRFAPSSGARMTAADRAASSTGSVMAGLRVLRRGGW